MAKKRFPHLFLPGPSTTRDDFSSPRQGGDGPRLRVQDRPTHAAYVKQALETAWSMSKQKQAIAHADRKGVYLEFVSEPGFNLILNSLESRQAGIKLLNVRTEDADGQEITKATVFVPQDKSAHFLQKATAYALEDNRPKRDGTTTPKNAPLIDSIGEVRTAMLESFWHGSQGRLISEDPCWVEVWLSSEDLSEIENFETLCRKHQIEIGEGRLTFPERVVVLILATRSQLEVLIEHSGAIAEIRNAQEVATFFIEEKNKDQVPWVDDLLHRTRFEDSNQVVVLILDHGVNNGHLLLEPVLNDADCHAAHSEWGTHDDHGHGTLMAGIAAYGDLLECVQNDRTITIRHRLESAKILPPLPEENPRRLWGHFTARGISEAEYHAPHRKRVICLAVTSQNDLNQGRPSSWSGQIDELASGSSDDRQRLIIISAGNVGPENWRNFPASNMTCEVHDPAQAWNALTVGAFTAKTLITDPTLTSFQAMAEAGDLSPTSSTSLVWPARKWPIKPEVLFEGGNIAKGPNDSIFNTEDLQLLSTYHNPQVAQFSGFYETSAASAQAAWMAARIQAVYPEAWPETVRGLIVHTANWTETQKRKHLHGNTKGSYYRLAKICGYGVPDLDLALSCAANSLSLIAQATIQPFHKLGSRYVSKDMHIYQLPWPVEVLRNLGETLIQMRVTLSYFVEPSPGEIGWKDRYRYASHALRFELNGSGEGHEEFVQRINRKARDEEDYAKTDGASSHWKLGEYRNVGSIHSDIWSGTAAELAASNLIAVHPAVGWWRERHHLGKFDRQTRYSLIVSFVLPRQDIDIYTPVSVQLGVPTPIEITI